MAPGSRKSGAAACATKTTRRATTLLAETITAPSQPQNDSPTPLSAPSQPENVSPTPLSAPSPSTEMSGVGMPLARRVRGPTMGKRVMKMFARNGNKRITIPILKHMRAFCGENAPMAAMELGVQIRRACPKQDFSHSWKHVDPMIKTAIMQVVRDKFFIHVDFDEDHELVNTVLDEKAYKTYKEWKHNMLRHYEKHSTEEQLAAGVDPYTLPYPGLTIDEWKFMIDHIFKEPKLKARRVAGKANRASLPFNHTGGSRLFPCAMTIGANGSSHVADGEVADGDEGEVADGDDGEVADGCQMKSFAMFFEKSHIKKNGEWINKEARDKHAELKNLEDMATLSGLPMTPEELSMTVLGEKKYYIRGFGVGPRPSSSSSKSSAESLAHEEKLRKLEYEMELEQEERKREREEWQREREQWQKERQREQEERQKEREDEARRRQEEGRCHDAQQKQLDNLQNIMKQVMEDKGCGFAGSK